MNVLIAGGTGFIGTYLTTYLVQNGHQVLQLTRKKAKKTPNSIYWDGKTVPSDLHADVIINLCGVNISARRWSKKVKKNLIDSRVIPTQAIVAFIKQYPKAQKPMLLNASAIGFYPSHPDVQTEDKPAHLPEVLFSDRLVHRWEAEAREALQYDATVSCLRFGVVLGKNGGMLKKLLPTYQIGAGASLGNKTAFLSWIHITDLCRAVLFILSSDNVQAAYNITSPNPCTKDDFSKALATACQKPYFLNLPEKIVRLLFGEMGEALLLSDQQIMPERLLNTGFEFKYKTIQIALDNLLEKK